ncbi:hypothetical protein [Mycobacteroides abscessus]|uniref:hypothetical protein n=1 Tax=Mycobacteroides abscessus TaxID=36809 RepID=UPI0005E0EB38|nr:hypothetical protein [Mycobacteroides abscessus]MBE5508559.1 hypothetical protein [Mycobacteroides abscessus]MBN7385086.1 hypothetical protein [Mycobacteroides abscessus subsp. abscessus]MBN7417384.1 hypothetical protein [Mycobacteroides abscessus subsp. abscessus]MBN7485307.1 hypothetical protein [Mycobacteroides abscessus subsp. abscessus]MBN7499973.1 hypothetical protein [Mycobacteroides abscessus subsp. abscessus]
MSDDKTLVLEATGVLYQLPLDETAFFQWLDKIPAVLSYSGYDRTLEIVIARSAVDEDALSEFVALYRRYHIDPAELQVFADHRRLGSWFSAPDRFWHKEIFDRPPPAEDRRKGPLFSGEHVWSIESTVGTHRNVWPVDADVIKVPDHVVLKATGVRYYSTLDENAFFERLDEIPVVSSCQGQLETLNINVNINSDGDEWDLAELAALYVRYNIDMTELRVLNAVRFGSWFSEPDRWWHKAVFG